MQRFIIRTTTILIIILSIIFSLEDYSTVYADGGIAVSGSFGNYHYKIVPGESIETPTVYMIFFNNYDNQIKVRLSQSVPDGVEITLEKTEYYMDANSSIKIPIGISVGEDVVPGDYKIHLSANVVPENSNAVTLSGSATLKTDLTVYGEAGHVNIDIVDVNGEPVNATMNLYHLSDDGKSPAGYSRNGVISERLAPGNYEVIAFWKNTEIAKQEFSLAADEEKNITLVARTINIYGFTATPSYTDESLSEVSTVRLSYVVDNFYRELKNARLVLNVQRNGNFVEDLDMYELSLLELGAKEYKFHYVPSEGWKSGEYIFKIEVYADHENSIDGTITNDVKYAESLEQILKIKGASLFSLLQNVNVIYIYVIGVALLILFVILLFTRRCKDCKGEKVLTCPICNGSGKTVGSEYEECIYCNGIGEVTCGSCVNKSHLHKCLKCDGDGYLLENGVKEECTFCNGFGNIVIRKYAKFSGNKKYKVGYKSNKKSN